MESGPGPVTELLRSFGEGRRDVLPRLVEIVYAELRRIAKARMRAEYSGHTLSPTVLVHEVYLRLAASAELSFQNRNHFLALAARAMRRIIVDHARAKNTARRGGENAPSPIDDLQIALPEPEERIVALDEALERLSNLSPRQCQVVELRYFVGMSEQETAEVLGVTRRTVERDWKLARAWLHLQVAP
jgi:RNA polymerase sigma factor (TIGR02999 family)